MCQKMKLHLRYLLDTGTVKLQILVISVRACLWKWITVFSYCYTHNKISIQWPPSNLSGSFTESWLWFRICVLIMSVTSTGHYQEDETILTSTVHVLQHKTYLFSCSKQVCCLTVTLDGTKLISGSKDSSVKLWDIISRQCIRTMPHKGWLDCCEQPWFANSMACVQLNGFINLTKCIPVCCRL